MYYRYVAPIELSDTLTVVKGCITRLVDNWDRLTEGDRQTLLRAARNSAERLDDLQLTDSNAEEIRI